MTNEEDIIENFNEDFDIRINLNNKKLLKEIFREYVSQNTSARINDLKMKKVLKIEGEIRKTFSKKELELFDKWDNLKDDYYSNEIEKVYIYRDCFYKELDNELNIKEL